MKIFIFLTLTVSTVFGLAIPNPNGLSLTNEESKAFCGVVCMIFCPYGNVLDSRGCPTCSCRPSSSLLPSDLSVVVGKRSTDLEKKQVLYPFIWPFLCGPVCAIYCPNGNVLDERGCKTCACKPSPSSQVVIPPSPISKDASPLDIFKKRSIEDEEEKTELTSVESTDDVCPPNMCRMYCENGFQVDENGCEICKCKESEPTKVQCPAVCKIKCFYGNYIDENGCVLCKCKPNPDESQISSDVTDLRSEYEANLKCPPKTCRIYCEFGFQVDENGCEICRCNEQQITVVPVKPDVCPPFMCKMYCETGFQVDENGCEICRCNDDEPVEPTQPVEPVGCGPVCMIFCEFGNVLDERGCPTCSCKPNPSAQITTPAPIVNETPNKICGAVCDIYCENGYEKDENDCPLCKCKQPTVIQNPTTTLPDEIDALEIIPACKPVVCMIACSNGYLKDKNGCETCACNSIQI